MFAYCRNNPVSRIDISGEYDLECNDIDPLDDELVHEDSGVGGTNNAANTRTNSFSTAIAKCLRIGSGHGSPTHSARINSAMDELVSSGDYKAVYGNRALSTAGLNGTQRPDIIAVHNDGTYEVWEFASISQATGTSGYRALKAKIEVMQSANPTIRIHDIVPWEGVARR